MGQRVPKELLLLFDCVAVSVSFESCSSRICKNCNLASYALHERYL
jgi:hypothetical protein